jgi:hypothetical protein
MWIGNLYLSAVVKTVFRTAENFYTTSQNLIRKGVNIFDIDIS